MKRDIAGLLKEAVAAADSARPLILDAGCNAGEHFEMLSRFGCVVGVDEDARVVEQAHAGYPDVRSEAHALCNLPFDEEFDLVFSDGKFHVLADQIGLLKSIARSLKPNGKLVVQMDGEGSMKLVQEAFGKALVQHSGSYACQFCLPRESAYRRVLDIAGFEVEFMETADCPQVLEGSKDGLRLFAEQHFSSALHLYRPEDRELVLGDFERAGREDLWDSTQQAWVADVRHLRFVARKARRVQGLGGSMQMLSLID